MLSSIPASLPDRLPIPADLDAEKLHRFAAFAVLNYKALSSAQRPGSVWEALVAADAFEQRVLYFDLVWRRHPAFEPRFPPPAVAVFTHAPFKGHRESYLIGDLSDVLSNSQVAWGERSFGPFAYVRPLPPEFPFCHERLMFLSYSLKGSGLAYRARLELKQLLPPRYRGLVKIARHLNGRPKTYFMDIVPRPDGVTYGPRNPPPGWRQMRKDDLALKWLYASFPEKCAGLEDYIRPEDFWRCATGRVHPEEVIQHFIRQTSFA